MKLLLDTHALLWFCEGSALLSAVARAAMENPTHQCYVSHASAWEIAIKLNVRKLKIQVSYDQLFPGVILANGFNILLPEFRHYNALLELPFHHRDPFDRLLIAQAKIEGMTLVTCDPNFSPYGTPLLW